MYGYILGVLFPFHREREFESIPVTIPFEDVLNVIMFTILKHETVVYNEFNNVICTFLVYIEQQT